jgi:diphthine-ammonia ligase
MGGYDVVALVSGGKDSVMAAMLAESYGHRVVALGNLLPSDARVEELDSHCFQTVGHNAVEAYGELTGLPLFRRRLRGASRHTEMTYEVGAAECAGDEVEDLRALLAAVVAKMPSVRAVSAGAILSDYQRLRVEAVCSDLGLVSLAYLWQQPQSSVLDLICDSHVHAVLVKVAAMGLDPKKHLGATLADARPTLREIERAFGSHCAGEGGEFETLVLDCPLFKRARLSIEGPPVPEIVITSPDPYAPSGHLAVARAAAVAVAKPAAQRLAPGEVIDAGAGGAPAPRAARRGAAEAAEDARARGVVLGEAETHVFSGTDAAAAHVRARVPATHADDPAAAAAASAEAALRAAAAALGDAFGLSWPDVDYVQLCVRDMNTFAAVNAAYVRVVPTHSPPARACVELPLPEGVPATVEVFASRRRAAPDARRTRAGTRAAPAVAARAVALVLGAGMHRPVRAGGDAARAVPPRGKHRDGPGDPLDRRGGGGPGARGAARLAQRGGGGARRGERLGARRGGRDGVRGGLARRPGRERRLARGGRRARGGREERPVGRGAGRARRPAVGRGGGASPRSRRREGGEKRRRTRRRRPRRRRPRRRRPRRRRPRRVDPSRDPRARAPAPQGRRGGGPARASGRRRARRSPGEDVGVPRRRPRRRLGRRRRRRRRRRRGGASARRRVVSFDAERVGARFVENRWCFARAAVARGDVTAAAVAGAVEALGGALRAAGLGWEHAGTFRGYYAVPERSDASGEEKDILGCFDRLETETELAGWIRIGGESASPCALAPALAVGFGETRDAGLVLEVSAATRARCDGRGRT